MSSPTTYPPTLELSLEPLELPTRAIDGPPTVAPLPGPLEAVTLSRATSPSGASGHAPDRFIAQATAEIRDGSINQRLWSRVLLVSGDDQSSARAAYIRARATALRLAASDQRMAGKALRSAATARAPESRDDGDGATLATSAPAFRRRLRGKVGVVHMSIAAAVLGFLAALWYFTEMRDSRAAMAVGAVPTAAVVSGAPVTQDNTRDAAAAADAAATAEIAAGLAAHVRSLYAAGSWNVMVLNASEWTRKQPENATAWNLLAVGYVKLGQNDEAREAARTAVRLAPADPAAWRTLGAVNVAVDEPEQALEAFTKASAFDDRNVDSLVQAGRLQAQLKRLPDANATFERALALDADDIGALCGQAMVSVQQGRAHDAEALQKRLKTLGRQCSEPAALTVPVAAADKRTRPKAVGTRIR